MIQRVRGRWRRVGVQVSLLSLLGFCTLLAWRRSAARSYAQDLIRGEVSWNTDTLGDFVILRSNGLPVYNFCVAVDDAAMGITHVIRAEEHLPNTLRQVLAPVFCVGAGTCLAGDAGVGLQECAAADTHALQTRAHETPAPHSHAPPPERRR